MLVLSRKHGQSIRITDREGRVLAFRVDLEITDPARPPRCGLIFDDPDRNFDIWRAERPRPEEAP